MSHKLKLLNLGCGGHFHLDWVNVDIAPHNKHVIKHDLLSKLPFEGGTFDVVYHSHVLEHIPRSKADAFIEECVRVLVPGGILRLVVPDLETIARLYIKYLEGGLAGDPVAVQRHEWMTLELLDQMVRDQPGGEMAKYWEQRPSPAEDFVIERTGQEFLRYRAIQAANPSPPSQPFQMDELQIARFRQSGEIHKWMYDRLAIKTLLEKWGLHQVGVCAANESNIPQYNSYLLDITSEGAIRKPDSLFIEGYKSEKITSSEFSVPSAEIELFQIIKENRQTGWPYKVVQRSQVLPPTLPDGKPWPKISVVTASYNQGKYIEETILSIANQNYPNVEHIIIDGGSNDETLSILEKYRHLFAYCVSEKDRGQCHAINKGFAQATGHIITWLNSDDMLVPGALEAMAMAFHTSGADMVAGICQIHRNGVILEQHMTSCADGPLPIRDLLDLNHGWNAGQFFYQPEVFFKRELWLRAGGCLTESIFINLDYELWLRFAKAGAKLKVIGRPIALFRMHEEQKTHDRERFLLELNSVRNQFIEQNPGVYEDLPVKPKKQTLRILMFNDIGFLFGAGIAHKRVAVALRQAGHEVTLVAGTDRVNEDPKDDNFVGKQLLASIKDYCPDLVIFGNVHNVNLNPTYLQEITRTVPSVFVMHDKWLITGRCAYSGDCQMNVLKGCDETCPTAAEYPRLPLKLIRPAWESKRALVSDPSRLVVAPNSAWIEKQFQDFLLTCFPPGQAPVRPSPKIKFGIPLDVFRPQNKGQSREILGLPQNKFLLFFSCTNLTDRRKGLSHLIHAIKRLAIPDLVPVCIGHGGEDIDLPGLISLGYIDSPHQMALLYSAADVFVAPSLEEAFGQVFVEAAACGTPSIAYPVGGVPEAVIDGITGRLATSVNPDSLAYAIREIYLNPELASNLGAWGRIYVENEFSPASSYHSLTFPMRQALRQQLIRKTSFLPHHAQLNKVQYILASKRLESSTYKRLKFWMSIRSSRRAARKVNMTQPDLLNSLLHQYDSKLKEMRSSSRMWFLMPKVWIARANRNFIRQELNEIKSEKPASLTEAKLKEGSQNYYRELLTDYRDRVLPWFFYPNAWLVRRNLRKLREIKK